MMRARALVVLLALLTPLAAAPAGPAGAEVVRFADRAGDGSDGTDPGPGRFGDIGAVKVNHAPRKVYTTVFPTRRGELADSYEIWIDTSGARRGPEFVAQLGLEIASVRVSRVSGFTLRGSHRVRCAARLKIDFDARTLETTLPRTCLAIAGDAPGRVRVSVHAQMDYESADWAPGVHRFGPWATHEL